jgi:3-oxoacyl-[acyl-carrier protein] reductase
MINYAQNAAAAEETKQRALSIGKERKQEILVEICRADISIAKEREALIGETRAAFGRLDLLVNNAGVAPAVRADLLDADESSFDRLMSINVKGPYFLTQMAARWMIEQQKAAMHQKLDRPKIVTISSVSAYTASTNRGDYCISKAALSMLTPLYASRLAEYGINVYEIRPGIIATDMTGPVKEKYDKLIAEGLTPLARWGIPQDVARAVAAIAQDLLPFSTGEVVNVDGGFHLRRL